MKFATERLIVREIKLKDIEFLLDIYNKEENMKFVSDGKFNWTKEVIIAKYDNVNKNYNKGIGIFAIELKENNTIIGEVGLFDSFNNFSKLELGYIIDSKFQNKGFGKEVCNGLLRYAKEKLNTEIIVARMYSENLKSIKLSETCGMKMIGSNHTDNGKKFNTYEKHLVIK